MKPRVSPSSASPKLKNPTTYSGKIIADSSCFDQKEHDNKLNMYMDGVFGIAHNHVYQAALKFQKHPNMRRFYKMRITTAHEDPEFLRDLFSLAMELDREAFNALLKNRE